ncbi:histone H1.1-like [Cimex lectularius]|uniref:H15 domain-containing protein n=1 Tax=Cimex lectularius TaxID=79782 RepID=A0A8I6RIM5_CIMLE|nr:histone H1.1-like [Cimex lectularius]
MVLTIAPTPAHQEKVKPIKGKAKKNDKPSHPPTAQMVNTAIQQLKDRGGSSLQAIKKYISSTYKVDAEKLSPFIRKYIRNAVASGSLVQTKGKGASGSFKLAEIDSKKKIIAKKTPAVKSPAKLKVKMTKKPPTTPKAPKPKKTKAGSAKKIRKTKKAKSIPAK